MVARGGTAVRPTVTTRAIAMVGGQPSVVPASSLPLLSPRTSAPSPALTSPAPPAPVAPARTTYTAVPLPLHSRVMVAVWRVVCSDSVLVKSAVEVVVARVG